MYILNLYMKSFYTLSMLTFRWRSKLCMCKEQSSYRSLSSIVVVIDFSYTIFGSIGARISALQRHAKREKTHSDRCRCDNIDTAQQNL